MKLYFFSSKIGIQTKGNYFYKIYDKEEKLSNDLKTFHSKGFVVI